jgi:hypothetical protein
MQAFYGEATSSTIHLNGWYNGLLSLVPRNENKVGGIFDHPRLKG